MLNTPDISLLYRANRRRNSKNPGDKMCNFIIGDKLQGEKKKVKKHIITAEKTFQGWKERTL